MKIAPVPVPPVDSLEDAEQPSRLLAVLKRLLPLVMIGAFGIAIWVLGKELAANRITDIHDYLKSLPFGHVLAAMGFTVASYVMLVGYDLLALRYVDKRVPLGSVALTSFISYAFTNTVGAGGFGTLTGGSVRYRLYAAAGLTGFEITAVIAFCLVTFFVGVMMVGGVTLLVLPEALAGLKSMPVIAVQGVGLLMAAPVVAYLIWSLLRRRALVIGKWRMRVPSFELALGQVTLSSLDIILAGAALYQLMPDSVAMSFPAFLGLYIVALVAGVVSHVPGGIGVFEGLMIALLPGVSAADAVGALLAYRAVYYLFPLFLAATLLAGSEVYGRRHSVAWLAKVVGTQLTGLAPQLTAVAAFIAGTVLLVSGATPTLDERLQTVQDLLPLSVLEASHLLGSIAGIGLLLLSRALLRRLDAAYVLTIALLFIGAITSLLKGLDYEEAMLLIFFALILIPARRAFYRHSMFVGQRFSGDWMAAVTVIVLGSVWLGLFSYRNIDYAHSLWWEFEFGGDAPRFLRATVAVVIIGMGYAALQLLRPLSPIAPPPGAAHVERLLPLVEGSSETRAALALIGDKHILFSEQDKGFLMYGVRGRSWVAMGDPLGPPETRAELAWKFRELCDQHSGYPVFYQVDAENLPLYVDLGLTLLKLGDEARVKLSGFLLDQSRFRDLRYSHRRSQRDGGTFEVVPASEIAALLPELQEVSEAWLEERKGQEKGFSVGYFDADYLSHFPCAIVRKGGKIIAFSNIWLGADKHELSVDLMRYRPHELYGVMDFLFVELFLWGKAQGYDWFNLGVAPLSGLDARHLSPVWYRVGSLAYRFGDQFYNFQGLRKYKEKFGPEWRPKYLACPGGLAFGRILLDVATLISGGVRGLITR